MLKFTANYSFICKWLIHWHQDICGDFKNYRSSTPVISFFWLISIYRRKKIYVWPLSGGDPKGRHDLNSVCFNCMWLIDVLNTKKIIKGLMCLFITCIIDLWYYKCRFFPLFSCLNKIRSRSAVCWYREIERRVDPYKLRFPCDTKTTWNQLHDSYFVIFRHHLIQCIEIIFTRCNVRIFCHFK